LRFNAWSGDDEALHVLMGVRAGSLPFLLSDDSLFPYSTGSLDFSFGLAFVDTVATAAWWVGAVATYPTRVEDSLDASGLYREFTQLTAGLRVPVWRFGVLAGATAYVPTGSATRQIYFADIDWRYSNAIGFFADVQAEGGPAESRVADYSFGLGTKINF
jgi:hypothetical protein